jgi:peptidoglycan/LPS O-acetylase OafA/YrhL
MVGHVGYPEFYVSEIATIGRLAGFEHLVCSHKAPSSHWGEVLKLNVGVAALGMSMFFSLSGFLRATQLLRDDNVRTFLITIN